MSNLEPVKPHLYSLGTRVNKQTGRTEYRWECACGKNGYWTTRGPGITRFFWTLHVRTVARAKQRPKRRAYRHRSYRSKQRNF